MGRVAGGAKRIGFVVAAGITLGFASACSAILGIGDFSAADDGGSNMAADAAVRGALPDRGGPPETGTPSGRGRGPDSGLSTETDAGPVPQADSGPSRANIGGDRDGCTQGAQRCSGNAMRACGTSGQWESAVACPLNKSCVNGSCTPIVSCSPDGAGMTNCGASSESCCTSLQVAGGTYDRTYTNTDSGPTGEAHSAVVSGFRLDKYLVTVGRFRQFVTAWNGGTGYKPAAGSGKHAHLNGSNGLRTTSGDYEPGWAASDNSNIAPTNANLACDARNSVWTAVAGPNENRPMNCVNWWESYAFCVWDGGFLPSESEWEYAAAGGSAQREYPWGSTDPGAASQYAIYGCEYPTALGVCTSALDIAPVGTATSGAGLWGQLDLAGEVWEWNLDYSIVDYVDPCTDCAYLTSASERVLRGAAFNYPKSYLAPSQRLGNPPANRGFSVGIRCARTP